jgi:hypothetical protein
VCVKFARKKQTKRCSENLYIYGALYFFFFAQPFLEFTTEKKGDHVVYTRIAAPRIQAYIDNTGEKKKVFAARQG